MRSMSQDLAVLKFHFPAAVLIDPLTDVAPSISQSHEDLQVLVDDYRGDSGGELSAEEVSVMLSGVQQRAAIAMSHLYSPQPHPPHSAPAMQAPRPGLGSNILPFMRRLASHAAAPAAGVVAGLAALRSALGARGLSPARTAHGASDSAHARAGLAAERSLGPQPSQAAAAAPEHAAPGPQRGESVLLQRALEDFKAFRFPRQTNKLAFVFDPSELGLSLSFGVEVFEPGHHTPLHIHKTAHELFFVLAGEGEAFCNGEWFTVRAGDCVVFPPLAVHGIDNRQTQQKLYCLQLMTPNEAFVEHVKSGEPMGRLDDEDICNLIHQHC